jgi:hypothetical protein
MSVSSEEKSLAQVQAELQAREPIFHRPEWGTSRAELEAMTAPDFWEVGASGRIYSREFVIDTVLQRYAHEHWVDDAWKTSDLAIRSIGEHHYLRTYTLYQGARITRRATLWFRSAQGWQIQYHQGTIVNG